MDIPLEKIPIPNYKEKAHKEIKKKPIKFVKYIDQLLETEFLNDFFKEQKGHRKSNTK